MLQRYLSKKALNERASFFDAYINILSRPDDFMFLPRMSSNDGNKQARNAVLAQNDIDN